MVRGWDLRFFLVCFCFPFFLAGCSVGCLVPAVCGCSGVPVGWVVSEQTSAACSPAEGGSDNSMTVIEDHAC